MKHLKLLLLAFVVAFTFACADDGATTSDNSSSNDNNNTENLPKISLIKAGIDIGFENPVALNKDDISSASEEYTVNLKSTATGGISNLFVTITSDNPTLNGVIDGIEQLVGDLDLADSSITGLLTNFGVTLPPIKEQTNVNIVINDLLAAFSSSITDNTTMNMNMRLVDANGEDNKTFTASITITPVVTLDPPTISLMQNTTDVGFNNQLELTISNTGAITSNDYVLNLSSTAAGGITSFGVTVTSNALATPSPLNIISANGETNFNLPINTLVGTVMIILNEQGVDLTTVFPITINMSLLDVNISSPVTESLSINADTSDLVVNNNLPEITLTHNNALADFASGATVVLDSNDTITSTDYSVGLTSSAIGGISNLYVTLSSDNTTIDGLFNSFGEFDLANVDTTDLNISIAANSLVPNHADIKGNDNISISINTLVGNLISLLSNPLVAGQLGGTIELTSDTNITIDMRLVDANTKSGVSESLVVTIDVPDATSKAPELSLLQGAIDIPFSSTATVTITDGIVTGDNYTLNLLSHAVNGITNFNTTITSTNNTVHTLVSAFERDLANLSGANLTTMQQYISNVADIDSGNDVDISINDFVKALVDETGVTEDFSITLNMSLLDENNIGSPVSETLNINVDLITSSVDSNPPAISMMQGSNAIPLSSGATVVYNGSSITSTDYVVNLASTATGGISNVNIALSTTSSDFLLNIALGLVPAFDLTNIQSDYIALVSGMVPNHADIKSSQSVNISINTLISGLISALSSFSYNVTNDTPITITMELIDANSTTGEQDLIVTIDVQ